MFRKFLFSVIVLWIPVAGAAPVGVFSEVEGELRLLRGDIYYEARPGVELEARDIVESGADGAAQIDLNDGSSLSVAANSQVLLAEYEIDDRGGVVRASIDLLSGWLRFAVAKLEGERSSYEFNTPVMTVGIRGTEGVIEAAGENAGLFLEEGRVVAQRAGFGDAPAVTDAPQVVEAGQYIGAGEGEGLRRRAGPPPEAMARMPARMKARLARRAQFLERRGFAPRQIRRMQRQDLRNYLNRHPRMKERLMDRFRDRWQNDPEFRDAFRHRAQQQQQARRQQARQKIQRRQAVRERLRQRRN